MRGSAEVETPTGRGQTLAGSCQGHVQSGDPSRGRGARGALWGGRTGRDSYAGREATNVKPVSQASFQGLPTVRDRLPIIRGAWPLIQGTQTCPGLQLLTMVFLTHGLLFAYNNF